MRILVTGAGGAASDNFIRSLSLADPEIHIVGSDTSPFHLQCAQVSERILLPSAYEDGYIDSLRQAITRFRIDFVHAQPDVEVALISKHRNQLPARVFLPPMVDIEVCHDKMRTNKILHQAGVPVPRSFLIGSVRDLPKLFRKIRGNARDKLWVRAVRGAGSRAALPVLSVRHAQEWIHYWRTMRKLDSRDFMLCEYLPGREFAFQSLWFKGKLIVSMARERLEYLFGNILPSGQSSSASVARTVHNQEVNSTATRAIKAVAAQPHGVYCVDLKENAEGRACVMEINIGRFFTTTRFFSSAGVNMPFHYVQLGLGGKVPALKQYDCLPENLYWIRGVDREPLLFQGEPWIQIPSA